MSNQQRSEQLSETYAGRAVLEGSSGNLWSAFLVRAGDGAKFFIGEGLSAQDADYVVTAALRAPQPVLKAGMLAMAWALERRARLSRAFPDFPGGAWPPLPDLQWSNAPARVAQ